MGVLLAGIEAETESVGLRELETEPDLDGDIDGLAL